MTWVVIAELDRLEPNRGACAKVGDVQVALFRVSGSDEVLRRMRRSYRADRFLGILQRVRRAMPDAAITTDIIVGFPGETEEDFQQTLDDLEGARTAWPGDGTAPTAS